jgi:hypothetical protein
MFLTTLCKCGAVDSYRNECRSNQTLDVAVHSTVIQLSIPELPVVVCTACGFTGVDGSADEAVRWALVTAGVIDCDKTYSQALETLLLALKRSEL